MNYRHMKLRKQLQNPKGNPGLSFMCYIPYIILLCLLPIGVFMFLLCVVLVFLFGYFSSFCSCLSFQCCTVLFGGFPHEVPMPNNQDPLAGPHQELRGRSTHRSRSGVRSHHTPPELCLRLHCQASWRHASPPSTPVSCRSDSRPSSWPKLEASPRSSQQPMDWPAMQGQQHATSWPVEKIHHTWSYGSDATVLGNYALMTTTTVLFHKYSAAALMCLTLSDHIGSTEPLLCGQASGVEQFATGSSSCGQSTFF